MLKNLLEPVGIVGKRARLSPYPVSLEVAPTDMRVEADEGQLSQALINLVKNAMQAVENVTEPEIVISASRSSAGHREIKITDNGPGIPPEIMDQVFIPFFTTKENGSGIGLSLTRQIMRNHGGIIEVASSPGNTRFTLKFMYSTSRVTNTGLSL